MNKMTQVYSNLIRGVDRGFSLTSVSRTDFNLFYKGEWLSRIYGVSADSLSRFISALKLFKHDGLLDFFDKPFVSYSGAFRKVFCFGFSGLDRFYYSACFQSSKAEISVSPSAPSALVVTSDFFKVNSMQEAVVYLYKEIQKSHLSGGPINYKAHRFLDSFHEFSFDIDGEKYTLLYSFCSLCMDFPTISLLDSLGNNVDVFSGVGREIMQKLCLLQALGGV